MNTVTSLNLVLFVCAVGLMISLMLGTLGKITREADYQDKDSPTLRIHHLCIGLIALSMGFLFFNNFLDFTKLQLDIFNALSAVGLLVIGSLLIQDGSSLVDIIDWSNTTIEKDDQGIDMNAQAKSIAGLSTGVGTLCVVVSLYLLYECYEHQFM